jgi:hypothetical protein
MKVMNDPRLIDLDSRWKLVISFRLFPFYFRGKIPELPFGHVIEGPKTGVVIVAEKI